MKNSENLWPKDLGSNAMTMPKEILLQQANFLSEMTKNIIVGEVRSSQGVLADSEEKVIVHELLVKAPSIGNYQFTLLRVMHNYTIYPISVYDTLKEVKVDATTEEEFVKILTDIFNNIQTKNALNGLIAQSM